MEYLKQVIDGVLHMECRDCGQMTPIGSDDVTSVLCPDCVREHYDNQFPFKPTTSHKRSGRPRGWAFMKEFVDKDGNVFHKGVEQPDLKGTLKPTKIKPKKAKPKLSKAQRESIRLKALSQLHKLKKQLVKAKTKKKQAELKRSIRKQQKLIK